MPQSRLVITSYSIHYTKLYDADSLPDQLVNSALKYKAQSPIVDSLLKDLGLDGSSLNGFTKDLNK